MKTTVIYEDKDVIVACKPAGFATQTAKAGQADMVSELKNYLAVNKSGTEKENGSRRQQAPYLGVVHRLDQPVEGLLVFAKNRETAASLTRQLSEGTLQKEYYAVICGKPLKEEGTLVDYLYKNGKHMAEIVTDGDAHFTEAKKAILHYRVLQRVDGISLMDIQIETGRFHQIRAQMAHGGMPLLGDLRYGQGAEEAARRFGVKNVALCACKIRFRHPATGKIQEFRTIPRGNIFSLFSFQNF